MLLLSVMFVIYIIVYALFRSFFFYRLIMSGSFELFFVHFERPYDDLLWLTSTDFRLLLNSCLVDFIFKKQQVMGITYFLQNDIGFNWIYHIIWLHMTYYLIYIVLTILVLHIDAIIVSWRNANCTFLNMTSINCVT